MRQVCTMSGLAPGTPCYIRKAENMPELNGRAVEVVGRWPEEPGEWYEIDAAWVRESFPNTGMIAKRENLLPIIPPEPENTKREKVTA